MPGRRQKSELTWDGVTEFWSRDRLPDREDSYLWMCADDAGTEVWAHFQSLGDDCVRLAACSPETAEILAGAIPHQHYDLPLPSAVCEFTKLVVQTLVLDDECSYELRLGRDDQDAVTDAALVQIPIGSLHRSILGTFQVLLRSDEMPRRVIAVPGERVVTFQAPRPWRRPLRRLRASLRMIGRAEHEATRPFEQRRADEPFETMHRQVSLARARATAAVGWNGRGMIQEWIADSYSMVRELRWRRFCIDCRDHVLATLSSAFRLIGAARGEIPELQCSDLPAIADVTESERLLREGERFGELLRPFGRHG